MFYCYCVRLPGQYTEESKFGAAHADGTFFSMIFHFTFPGFQGIIINVHCTEKW